MGKHVYDIETTGSKHRPSVRRRRRLGVPVGALLTGGALLFGTVSMADAGVHDPITDDKTRPVTLYDNCGTGFKGYVKWTDGAKNDTIKVTFTPPVKPAGQGYSAADLDLRGDYKDPSRDRTRVFRMRHDFETLTPGKAMSWTFSAPRDILLWRVSVGAVEEGPLATEVHALEAEKDPAACD